MTSSRLGLLPRLVLFALVLIARPPSSALGEPPPGRPFYEAVLHQSGAPQRLWPLHNVIIVAFSDAATPDTYYQLAEAERLRPRSEPKHVLADHAAIYTLRDDQAYAEVKRRIESYKEVLATLPAFVTETLDAAFVHPARFDVEVPDASMRPAVVERLTQEFGASVTPAQPQTPPIPFMTTPALPAAARDSTGEVEPPLLAVALPRHSDLFAVISATATIPGVRSFGFMPLHGTVVEHTDTYLVRGEKLEYWHLEVLADELYRRTVRQNYFPVDSLLVIEYRRPPDAEERQALFTRHGLRRNDPDVAEYDETQAELSALVDIVRTAGSAELTAKAIIGDARAQDLVRGALPGLRRPKHEIETALYLRPCHLRVEFDASADSIRIEGVIRKQSLREIGRTTVAGGFRAVDAELPEGLRLFPTLRALKVERGVLNALPIQITSDTEVQLRAGHLFQREPPFRTYVDRNGDSVRLHAIDRTLVVTFAHGATRGDRERLAKEFGLTLLPMNQNLGPMAPNLVYQAPAGQTSRVVAAAIKARQDLSAVVTGAMPGLFDRDLMTWVYAPEHWLRVAFEPKMPEADIRAILIRYGLRPALDPDVPAADDPYLDPRGAFWNYYVSRRIPLQATAADAMEIAGQIGHEPGVLWAHPYTLTPSFDRGNQLFLTAVGGGWYHVPKLDATLNMLVHLWRTTSADVVQGYADRAKLKTLGRRLQVVVELDQPSAAAVEVLAAHGLEVLDTAGKLIFGIVDVAHLPELAELPAVQWIAAKLVRNS